MNDSKPWYASKGIWGGVIAVLAAVLGAFGYTVGPEDMQQLSVIGASIGGSIGGVIGVIGRVKATKTVGK